MENANNPIAAVAAVLEQQAKPVKPAKPVKAKAPAAGQQIAKGALFAPVGELSKDGSAVLDKSHAAAPAVIKAFAVAVSAQQKADSAYTNAAQKLLELGITSSMLEDVEVKTAQGKVKRTSPPLAVAVKRELILRGMSANQQRLLTAAVSSLSAEEIGNRTLALGTLNKVFRSTLQWLKACESGLEDGSRGTKKPQTLEQKLLKLCNEMLKIIDSAKESRCDSVKVEDAVKDLKVLINKKASAS